MENIRDPLRYLSKALDIFYAFRENGISIESSIVLMNLYDESLQHQELMEKTKIESPGEFMLVITDLKIKGYVENSKTDRFSITQKGKTLVEEVLKETRYIIENGKKI